ncbi:hypothetical protein [Streptacidiphilus melanogenes]|uniref:hypothetical protein n=1 Tax=Streptacidiphilus melanogenes TaxID=411235 RepID=UPI0005A6316A|nr:hypothetical protein [Streptacidiphilus melanogenes]
MNEPMPATIECLYSVHDPNWDDIFTGYEILRWPITKKTAKQVHVRDEYGKTSIFNRQQLEADGYVWSPRWHTTLWLKEPAVATSAKKPTLSELKQAMADAHPDRGGSDEAFIAARQKYETARRRAGR